MNKPCPKKSLLLYSVHIPVLIALIGLSVIGLGVVTRNASQQQKQAVLSDEEERDSGDDPEASDHEDENKDEDNHDSEDSTHDSEDEKDSESEDKDSDEIKPVTTQYTQQGTVQKVQEVEDEAEDENEVENEDSEEPESDEKTELVSTVTNPDGTVTKTFKKTEGDEVEMKAITYNANGEKISEVELNPDGTPKVEEKEADDQEPLDADGHEVEFEYKAQTGTVPELPKLIEAELEQEIETNAKLGESVDKVELEVKTVDGKYEYEGSTIKNGKLFGLFDITIPVGIEFDPSTGKIISISQTFWSKLLDVLSF